MTRVAKLVRSDPRETAAALLLSALSVAWATAPAVAEEAAAGPAFQAFGSAAAYGGPSQKEVSCTITNVGKKPVQVRNLQIIDQSGAVLNQLAANCGSGLLSQKTCIALASVANDHATRCSARVDDSGALRGRLIVYGPAAVVLSSQPLE